MTPARNNVRATRHFGIPARKSSPSAPLQPFPREKNSPGTPLQQFPREKVRPATASPWPNREKTLPARPKTPKSSHFSRAGRTFSRFQRRTTEQGDFSPATTPLNTHHRDTTTQPPPQPVQNSPHNTHLKAQPVQNSPNTPTINENWPFLASKENYFPFPTPHHRAGRIFSRNNTTQYPSQGHHHPNRHKTHPATPPTTCSARGTSQHAGQNSPGTPLQPFPRKKTRPATAQSWPNREKTLPARPKTPKSSHFSRAGRTFSRFPNQFTPQGELFRVSNTAPPSRENFLPQLHHSIPITGTPPPQPAQNPPSNAADNVLSPGHESARAKEFAQHPLQPFPREKTRPATAQSWPNREKLSQRAQKHQNLANFPEQGELFRVSQTNSPRRANFFAQIQHSTCNSGTPLARHTQQSTHTLVIERKPLVVHRLSFPLVVIHRLTRKA